MKVENGVLIKVEPGDIENGSFHSWEGITSIGEWAFVGCESLKSIELPPNITSIGSYAFQRCNSLKSIVLSEDITEIEEGAFAGCESLESIELPPNITSIGSYAFAGCKSLKSIKLPPNITEIKEGAFQRCLSLKSIKLPPKITKIGRSAFRDCKNLKSILLSQDITEIEEGAFVLCESLESLVLPPNITSIGSHAFSGCNSLKSIVLSPKIDSIGRGMFHGCEKLDLIYIPACDDATRARIINLLPEELRSKVAPAGLLEEILSTRDRELQRIVQTPYTNPMGRIAKSGLPIPDDVLKEMNGFLGEDNRFLSKARSQIDALPLPSNVNKISEYQQQVQAIVDEAIARSKSGITPPVMPEVLNLLKRLEDKVLDLSNRGEEEAATTLRGLCAEVWALLYDNLDPNAFQEKCKQAIEEKREVLGAHRGAKSTLNSLQNHLKSSAAFFKTDTIKLLDALIETIEQKAPKQSPSQSSR